MSQHVVATAATATATTNANVNANANTNVNANVNANANTTNNVVGDSQPVAGTPVSAPKVRTTIESNRLPNATCNLQLHFIIYLYISHAIFTRNGPAISLFFSKKTLLSVFSVFTLLFKFITLFNFIQT